MTNFKELIDAKVAETIAKQPAFDVLFITSETSRLSYVRGFSALEEVKRFYANIMKCSLTKMSPEKFCRDDVDISKYSVVWVDNVADRAFNNMLNVKLKGIIDEMVPGWDAEMPSGDDAIEEYLKEAMEYRALSVRVIYSLDEFVWEAPGGRQKNVITAKTVEDAMAIADEVIVPNAELSGAITELGLVPDGKDVLVIPSFMNENFFPVNRMVSKSSKVMTSIRRPKVLVKGVYIPESVQNLIIHGSDKYDFTISSIVELDPRLMKLLESRAVKNIQHWANPYVNSNNLLTTMAIERDQEYDFVILTYGDNASKDIYAITDTDTDALIAVASGSVVIAGVGDMEFQPGTHLAVDTGMSFKSTDSVKAIGEMLAKWSICANWDSVYGKQHQILMKRLVSSPMVMGGYFNAMLGRTVSEARRSKFAQQAK